MAPTYNAPTTRPAPPGPPAGARRGAGVVDRDGLENRCGCKLTVGSNPTLSARRYPYMTVLSLFPVARPTSCYALRYVLKANVGV